MRRDVEAAIYYVVAAVSINWPVIHGLIDPEANTGSDLAVFGIGLAMIFLARVLFDSKS